MATRFAFAVLLVLLQVVFTVYEGAPSVAALDGALAICAAVLPPNSSHSKSSTPLRQRLDRPRTKPSTAPLPAAPTRQAKTTKHFEMHERPPR